MKQEKQRRAHGLATSITGCACAQMAGRTIKEGKKDRKAKEVLEGLSFSVRKI